MHFCGSGSKDKVPDVTEGHSKAKKFFATVRFCDMSDTLHCCHISAQTV